MNDATKEQYLAKSLDGYRHEWRCGNIPSDADISDLVTYQLQPGVSAFLQEHIDRRRSQIQQDSATKIEAATRRVELATAKVEDATKSLKTPRVLVVLGAIAAVASIVSAWPIVRGWMTSK